MATVVTDDTDGQYVRPRTGVRGGVITLTQTPEANGVEFANRTGAQLTILTVQAADDAETITTGIENIIAVAWQSNNPDNDGHVSVFLSTQAQGIVTFDKAGNDAEEGWLWVLHGGPSAAAS